ncbi:FecR family protein [Olivibacter domesticus]|uniref:FecR family protein n=1 Tax=Olivibacter domesticus TaxID=407022 RepID=A0A1H7IFU1_OLID1|nr:FecR family protein [Olivibacter domesticus]SEK61318.1 FecR family protein [Olivibacter domesticus]
MNHPELVEKLCLKLYGLLGKEDNDYLEQLIEQDVEVRSIWEALLDNHENAPLEENNLQASLQGIKQLLEQRKKRRGIIRKGVLTCLLVMLVGSVTWWLALPRPSLNSESILSLPESKAVTIRLAGGAPIALPADSNWQFPSGQWLLQVRRDTLQLFSSMPEKAEGWHVLQVPDGHRYTLVLGDASTITLDPQSQLKFPASFHEKTNREVYLEGSGTFTIAPEKRSTFIVHTDQANVTVLGTRFEVSSRNALFRTKLIRGKVRLSVGNETVVLTAGQTALLPKGGSRFVLDKPHAPAAAKAMAGVQLENFRLDEIAERMRHHYHIQVVVDEASQGRNFDGSVVFAKEVTLEQFLKNMEQDDSSFHYQWHSDTLYIK